jgi:hypothetical protein
MGWCTLQTIQRRALRLQISEAGDNQKRLRKIAEKLLKAAEKGESWAIAMIADRGWMAKA